MGKTKKMQGKPRVIHSMAARRSARADATSATKIMTQYPAIESPEIQIAEARVAASQAVLEKKQYSGSSLKLPAVTARDPATYDRIDPETVLETWLDATLGGVDEDIFRSLSNLSDDDSTQLSGEGLAIPVVRDEGRADEDSEMFLQSSRDKDSTMKR